MKTAGTRRLVNQSVWYPKYEHLDKADTLSVFAQRAAMIVEMAEQNLAIAIEPLTLTAIKSVKEIGALVCYGNPRAQDVINELLPAVITLDDTLATISSDAAKRARVLLEPVGTEARLWKQRHAQSVLLAMSGQA